MVFNLRKYAQENIEQEEELADPQLENSSDVDPQFDNSSEENSPLEIEQPNKSINPENMNSIISDNAKQIADKFHELIKDSGLDGLGRVLSLQDSQNFLNRIIDGTLTRIEEQINGI